MLGDDVDNRLRKMHLVRPFDPFLRGCGLSKRKGADLCRCVYCLLLVFDKIFGLFEFSRIVIIRADARQKSVCTDRRTRVFRQSCNEHGMVVSSGRRQSMRFISGLFKSDKSIRRNTDAVFSNSSSGVNKASAKIPDKNPLKATARPFSAKAPLP